MVFCKEIQHFNNNKFYQLRKTKFENVIKSNAYVNNSKAWAFCIKETILNPVMWMLLKIWHLHFDDGLNLPILLVLVKKMKKKNNLYSNPV